MELSASSSKDEQICKICSENQRRYICPKCGIEYCSIECYKSASHMDCSETFYKQCVKEELQIQQCDPALKQKTLHTLQRIYNDETDDDILNDIFQENEHYNDEEELDSDDENIPTLEKRLENINLDNADELWSALTVSERQEFEALIQSGEVTKLLPSWSPWWTYSSKQKLIEDVDDKDENQIYKSHCPKILDIPTLKSVSKASPFIRFSIINAVYAYAYSVLYFNGEHQATSLDAVYIFLRICDTMRINQIFQDNSSAVENVLLEITNCDSLAADQETILRTKEAGDAILNGPEEKNKSFYTLAALSDLDQLMHNAKKQISIKKLNASNCEFKSKFQSHIDLGQMEMSKRNLSLLSKKIEFYIAWLKSQSQRYDIAKGEKV